MQNQPAEPLPDAVPDLRRWPVAVAGVAVQMVLGTVYAWSVFKRPLMDLQGWTSTQTGVAFTLVILFIGVSAALGGRFVDRAGSRKVATLAAVLFAFGTLMAGVAAITGNLWVLWLGYGVVGGIGNGLGYITPIAVLVRWFPDKRGMITGLAVMGFGLGAALMGQIAPLLIPRLGVATTFYISAGIFLVALLVAAQKLNNPPEGWVPPAAKAAARRAVPVRECELREALRMPQFYVLWSPMFLNITAGLAIISNLSPFAQEQLGVLPVLAGTIVFITSLANGFGRIVWASLSDALGRKATFVILVAGQIPLFLLLPHVHSFAAFTVICSYLLLCYGGGFGSMPAFAADTFGTRCMGQIYGKILLAWGVAGVVGPTIMDYARRMSGGYTLALQIAAAALLMGSLLALTYRRPAPAAAEAQEPSV